MSLTNRLFRRTPSSAAPKARRPELVRRACILVVLELEHVGPSLRALRRARAMASLTAADLTLLVVRAVVDDRTPIADRTIAQQARNTTRGFGLVDWLMGHSTDRLGVHVLARPGDPTEVAAQVAGEIGASLIVVGAERSVGGKWARVAGRSQVPVLVARRARQAERAHTIVAATDCSDRRFPTFDAARRLADKECGEVLLVHNVDPDGFVFHRRAGIALSPSAGCGMLERRRWTSSSRRRGSMRTR